MTVVTQEFHGLAKAAAEALGYPDLPMVVVPHPFETKPVEEVRALAEAKFEEIIAKATASVDEPVLVPRHR